MGDSYIEMADLLNRINGTVFVFVGGFIIFLSYFILLGTPIISLVYSLKNMKDDANRNNDGNQTFVFAKAGIVALVVTAFISLMYFFVFVDVLHIGSSAGEVVKRVLLLSSVSK